MGTGQPSIWALNLLHAESQETDIHFVGKKGYFKRFLMSMKYVPCYKSLENAAHGADRPKTGYQTDFKTS